MPKASDNKDRLLFYILFIPLFLLAITITFLVTGYLGPATLVGALLGIWLAWCLNQDSAKKRRQDEYRSLLVSFVHELEEDYHRCVLYHTQQQNGIVSFSAIFDFNDASTLSKLASVTNNPKIVDAIMFLKKQYFQVGRYVENASGLATEYTRRIMEFKIKHPNFDTENDELLSRDAPEIKKLKDEALHAQGVALAFFKGGSHDNATYPEIVDSTILLIEELKDKWADAAEEFQSRFEIDRKKMSKTEQDKRGAIKGK